MRKTLLAVLVGLLASAPLYASQCPSLWKKVDAALQTAQIDDVTRAEVEQLRAEGQSQHEAGQHAESVTTLNRALEKLGAL